MTPILSLETILSAMMCFCSGGNNTGSLDNFLTMDGNFKIPSLIQGNEGVQTQLANLAIQLAEFKVQQSLILAKLQKHHSESPQFRLGLSPRQYCPTHTVSGPDSIYNIKLSNYDDIFPVLCSGNDDHGMGWMVIQQRLDGSENFLRSWAEYRQGFGLLNGEFFLGLDKIHALTSQQLYKLIIIMENFEGESRFALYENFVVGSEAEGFPLHVGNYSGTAEDSLTEHNAHKFTTFDRDNDDATGNCATEYTGAWWYRNCHTSNLNGQYYGGGKLSEKEYAKGVTWESFGGQYHSLKTVKMMIRPMV